MAEGTQITELSNETEKQLAKVLLYQPDIVINANFTDPSTVIIAESLAKMFTTGVNRVELLNENFHKKNFQDVMGMGFGEADIAFEVITNKTPFEGLHHKMSRELYDDSHKINRFVLDTTAGLVKPRMEGIKDLPIHKWPGSALDVLLEMEDLLAKDPNKKWYPHFVDHLDWLAKKAIDFDLSEFKKLVPYDQDIPNEFSKFVVVDTSKEGQDVHPLQKSVLIGKSVNIKAMDTGYVHVNCLSGCGAEIPSVALKGNNHEGIIVAGSHCDSCGSEYNPKFPNTTLKKILSKVKM